MRFVACLFFVASTFSGLLHLQAQNPCSEDALDPCLFRTDYDNEAYLPQLCRADSASFTCQCTSGFSWISTENVCKYDYACNFDECANCVGIGSCSWCRLSYLNFPSSEIAPDLNFCSSSCNFDLINSSLRSILIERDFELSEELTCDGQNDSSNNNVELLRMPSSSECFRNDKSSGWCSINRIGANHCESGICLPAGGQDLCLETQIPALVGNLDYFTKYVSRCGHHGTCDDCMAANCKWYALVFSDIPLDSSAGSFLQGCESSADDFLIFSSSIQNNMKAHDIRGIRDCRADNTVADFHSLTLLEDEDKCHTLGPSEITRGWCQARHESSSLAIGMCIPGIASIELCFTSLFPRILEDGFTFHYTTPFESIDKHCDPLWSCYDCRSNQCSHCIIGSEESSLSTCASSCNTLSDVTEFFENISSLEGFSTDLSSLLVVSSSSFTANQSFKICDDISSPTVDFTHLTYTKIECERANAKWCTAWTPLSSERGAVCIPSAQNCDTIIPQLFGHGWLSSYKFDKCVESPDREVWCETVDDNYKSVSFCLSPNQYHPPDDSLTETQSNSNPSTGTQQGIQTAIDANTGKQTDETESDDQPHGLLHMCYALTQPHASTSIFFRFVDKCKLIFNFDSCNAEPSCTWCDIVWNSNRTYIPGFRGECLNAYLDIGYDSCRWKNFGNNFGLALNLYDTVDVKGQMRSCTADTCIGAPNVGTESDQDPFVMSYDECQIATDEGIAAGWCAQLMWSDDMKWNYTLESGFCMPTDIEEYPEKTPFEICYEIVPTLFGLTVDNPTQTVYSNESQSTKHFVKISYESLVSPVAPTPTICERIGNCSECRSSGLCIWCGIAAVDQFGQKVQNLIDHPLGRCMPTETICWSIRLGEGFEVLMASPQKFNGLPFQEIFSEVSCTNSFYRQSVAAFGAAEKADCFKSTVNTAWCSLATQGNPLLEFVNLCVPPFIVAGDETSSGEAFCLEHLSPLVKNLLGPDWIDINVNYEKNPYSVDPPVPVAVQSTIAVSVVAAATVAATSVASATASMTGAASLMKSDLASEILETLLESLEFTIEDNEGEILMGNIFSNFEDEAINGVLFEESVADFAAEICIAMFD